MLAAGLALGCATSVAAGTNVKSLWQHANQSFFRGEYASAIQEYRELIDSGIDDPDVHFNLGIAWTKEGEYGRAILEFERTLRKRPWDEDATRGLAAAHTVLARQRAEATGEGTLEPRPFKESLVLWMSDGAFAWTALALHTIFFALIALRLIRRRAARHTTVHIGIAASAVLALFAWAGLGIKSGFLLDGRPAVVLQDAVLREGPDPHAKTRGQLKEGDEAYIVETHHEFQRIKTRNGEFGWIHSMDIDAI